MNRYQLMLINFHCLVVLECSSQSHYMYIASSSFLITRGSRCKGATKLFTDFQIFFHRYELFEQQEKTCVQSE